MSSISSSGAVDLTSERRFWYHTRLCWRDGRAWLNAHDSKSCIPARVSGVRIPLSPPNLYSAGVIQWQNRSFPSFLRGFDSHRPLHFDDWSAPTSWSEFCFSKIESGDFFCYHISRSLEDKLYEVAWFSCCSGNIFGRYGRIRRSLSCIILWRPYIPLGVQ